MKAGSKGPRKLDISYPTTEFTKLVKLWDKYNEADMSITVRHIKSYGFLVLDVRHSCLLTAHPQHRPTGLCLRRRRAATAVCTQATQRWQGVWSPLFLWTGT